MTEWRLLDDNPESREWFQYDDATGDHIVKTEYKNTGLITDLNKATQGADVGKSDWGHHVARVPMSVVHQWMQEAGVTMMEALSSDFLRKKLDDPDYRHLRVNTGRIGVRKQMW